MFKFALVKSGVIVKIVIMIGSVPSGMASHYDCIAKISSQLNPQPVVGWKTSDDCKTFDAP